MAIFRGVGGSGDSSDNSFLQEVTAQANAAEASATSAANSLAAIQQTEVTSASFDTGNGVLTLAKTGGATVTADLDGRFLTSYTETNNLSSAVTWANVPDANITQSSVTQHQAALSITESQISDLQSYLTSYTETNNLSTAVTWANVPNANITESSVTQHQAALSVTESQISDFGTYLTAHQDISGKANLSGATFTGDVSFNDGVKAKFGTDSDLLIYHNDGEPSVIEDAGELGLVLKTNGNIFAVTSDTNESMITATPDGGVTLHYDGTSKVNVGQDSVAIDDDLSVQTGNDLYVRGGELDVTGDIVVSGTVDGVDVATLGANALTTHQDITGKANLSGATFTGDVRLSDDVELKLGDGDDFRIFHSSATGTTTIREQGTGSLLIQGENLNVTDTSTKSYLSAIAGASTKIYYNGFTRLTTLSGGISVAGDIAVSGTVDGVDIAALNNTVVPSKANLSGANFTGAVAVGSLSSTQTFDVFGATSLYNGLNVVGNITSTGTVDGRDVAADGTKLDGIGKFSFGDPSNIPVQTTAPVTLITSDIPAAGTEVGQYVTARFSYRVRNATTATKKNFSYQIRSEMKSKNTTGVSLGTATYVSSPSSYNGWYYVSGNKTHIISAGRGKVGTTSGGVNSGNLIGSYYDAANDRTYIRISKYPDYNTVYNNVEIFYSVDSFTSVNTWVVQNTYYNTKYVSLVHSANETKHITINDFFGRHSTATTFRIQVDNLSSVSGWDLDVYDLNGTVENAL